MTCTTGQHSGELQIFWLHFSGSVIRPYTESVVGAVLLGLVNWRRKSGKMLLVFQHMSS